jgi:hypothetical protein
MKPEDGCRYKEDVPKVIVVAADNDKATGSLFTASRIILTALESYPAEDGSGTASNEHDANIHAIGFTDRYITHRLCLQDDSPGDPTGPKRAVASLTPPEKLDWSPVDRFAPVWVVRAPPRIIDGHNGFFFAAPDPSSAQPAKQEPYLLNWLINLHTFGPGKSSRAMADDNRCNGPELGGT